MATCIACKNDIDDDASICAHCGTSQTTWVRWIGYVTNPVTLFISIASLIISGFAFWNTVKPPSGSPFIQAQNIAFDADDFSVLVYNLGSAPTVISWVDLSVSLSDGQGGTFSAEAGYSLEAPIQLLPGEAATITVEYSDFAERWTRWIESDPPPRETFSTSFLNLAAALGSNLHCSVKLVHSQPEYFRSYGEISSESNGTCTQAMERLARLFGPLRTEVEAITE